MEKFLYSINVNQCAIIMHNIDIDIIDASIFCCIERMMLSQYTEKMFSKSKVYTWIKWTKILEDMPMIAKHIKTRQGVAQRLNNLKSNKLIEAHPDNQVNAMSWYTLGEKAYLLNYVTSGEAANEKLQGVNESLQGCKPEFTEGVKNSLHNNNTTDNNTTNKHNKKTKKVFLVEEVELLFESKKASTLFEEVYKENFLDARYNFTDVDFVMLKKLLAKLYEAMKKKSDNISQMQLLDGFDFFLRSAVKDEFVKKAYFTIPKLNKNFQEVLNKIILNEQSKRPTAKRGFNPDDIAKR